MFEVFQPIWGEFKLLLCVMLVAEVGVYALQVVISKRWPAALILTVWLLVGILSAAGSIWVHPELFIKDESRMLHLLVSPVIACSAAFQLGCWLRRRLHPAEDGPRFLGTYLSALLFGLIRTCW